ncbi:MAG: ATP-binding cassette domain-containing protein [Terriglobales bacterium]
MLEAHGLSKSYSGIAAVTDVSFAIDPGQVLGCLGPNGSGKSTTVKMLLGIIEPSRGQVLFDGSEIGEDLAAYRKQLGYVPEEPNLYPYLSGREYPELVGTLRGMERPRRDAKIDALLEQFAISGVCAPACGGLVRDCRVSQEPDRSRSSAYVRGRRLAGGGTPESERRTLNAGNCDFRSPHSSD